MSPQTSVQPSNRLLESLPRRLRDRLLNGCESVSLSFGTVLCERDQRLLHVYFPVTGFISLVAPIGRHPALELGLIGNEGMLGVTLVLGVGTGRLRSIVQGTGTALRMGVSRFRRELRESPALRRTLNRYVYVLLAQLSQTAACTRFHEIKARLACWLLLTHDRSQADTIYLTHQYLADMLGVQRSAVTIAAGELQKKKLIHYSRGAIEIRDRRGLEAASCECYEAEIRDYKRLFA